MNKRSEALFRRLRHDAIFIGAALIVFFLVDFFTELFTKQILRIVIFMAGGILLISGSQKYLEEHPKMRKILIWILAGLLLLGLVIFFIVNAL